MNPDLQLFLQAWTGGADVSEAERQRLLELLENDALFRAECVEEIRLLGMIKAVQTSEPRWIEMHDALGLSKAATDDPGVDDLASRVVHRLKDEPRTPVKARVLSWRPVLAAAAGLAFGLFSASVVFGFGFGGRPLEKPALVLDESFESGAPPLITGIPQTLNHWSGDYSEIVGEQHGVRPAVGRRMACLLRSDFEGRISAKPSRQADLMRMVDVRPFLREAHGGDVVMTLSALFNASPAQDAERYDGVATIWALDRGFPTEESLMHDALAHSVGMCRSLDFDVNTWQKASTRLLLPPGTEMVLLKVSFSPIRSGSTGSSGQPDHVTFPGNFVDEVHATISVRSPQQTTREKPLP